MSASLYPDGPAPPVQTRRAGLIATFATLILLAFAGSASASIVQLPPGAQVNDDGTTIPANQNAGASDVVGGSLVAGGLNVPWATFEQKTGAGQQIFVRAFKAGAWVTQGTSLNITPSAEAEEPSIDFAGPNRTVPWATWYEPNAHLGNGTQTNIFASRFTGPTGTPANTWIPDGQDRAPADKVPSLNIHTDRNAVDPAVAGGVAAGAPAGAAPSPWVAWEETDGVTPHEQIFVSRAIKQTDCSANKPGGGTSVSAFCWQQVGNERLLGANAAPDNTNDPTLNIDPKRDGESPDIAFTGTADGVPWVVWYEEGNAPTSGLSTTDLVFAAKAVPNAVGDPNPGDGGFHWVAVGNGTAGQNNVLDTSGSASLGSCAGSLTQEKACSLNKDATQDAQDPRVAAGSLTPGGATVPWVVWTEKDSATGKDAIFVSRLVNKDHFELFNGGAPISDPTVDSNNADITFEGNVPYITWHEDHGAGKRVFSGHFEGSTFVNDTPGGLLGGTVDGLRAPISSTCTANPFTADGASCPAGAAGTPFFLRTTSDTPQALLAHAYAADAVQTGAATAVTQTTATIAGEISTGGGPVNGHVEFGTTTAYGGATPNQRLDSSVSERAISADLAGLPAGTVIHYRVVASTDFGTVDGADATFTTASPPPPPPPPGQNNTPPANGNHNTPTTHVVRPTIGPGRLHIDRHRTVGVSLSCPKGGARCTGTLKLVVRHKVVGEAKFSIAAAHRQTVKVRLSAGHARTLRHARKVTLEVGSRRRTVKIS